MRLIGTPSVAEYNVDSMYTGSLSCQTIAVILGFRHVTLTTLPRSLPLLAPIDSNNSAGKPFLFFDTEPTEWKPRLRSSVANVGDVKKRSVPMTLDLRKVPKLSTRIKTAEVAKFLVGPSPGALPVYTLKIKKISCPTTVQTSKFKTIFIRFVLHVLT